MTSALLKISFYMESKSENLVLYGQLRHMETQLHVVTARLSSKVIL